MPSSHLAGKGNWTLTASLEGWSSTIELHPPSASSARIQCSGVSQCWMTIWSWTPGNSEILMVCNNRQIAKRLLLIAIIFFYIVKSSIALLISYQYEEIGKLYIFFFLKVKILLALSKWSNRLGCLLRDLSFGTTSWPRAFFYFAHVFHCRSEWANKRLLSELRN